MHMFALFEVKIFSKLGPSLLSCNCATSVMTLSDARENRQFGFPTRSDINQPLQSQEQARRYKKEKELHYPCSENKGTDQLRSYCETDLRLCFRICRLLVFPCGGSLF